jgi:hypothetical protein
MRDLALPVICFPGEHDRVLLDFDRLLQAAYLPQEHAKIIQRPPFCYSVACFPEEHDLHFGKQRSPALPGVSVVWAEKSTDTADPHR